MIHVLIWEIFVRLDMRCNTIGFLSCFVFLGPCPCSLLDDVTWLDISRVVFRASSSTHAIRVPCSCYSFTIVRLLQQKRLNGCLQFGLRLKTMCGVLPQWYATLIEILVLEESHAASAGHLLSQRESRGVKPCYRIQTLSVLFLVL